MVEPLPPALFSADKGVIAFEALKDGKLRVTYAGWDDAKVILPGERLELVWRGGQAVAYKKGKPRV